MHWSAPSHRAEVTDTLMEAVVSIHQFTHSVDTYHVLSPNQGVRSTQAASLHESSAPTQGGDRVEEGLQGVALGPRQVALITAATRK